MDGEGSGKRRNSGNLIANVFTEDITELWLDRPYTVQIRGKEKWEISSLSEVYFHNRRMSKEVKTWYYFCTHNCFSHFGKFIG